MLNKINKLDQKKKKPKQIENQNCRISHKTDKKSEKFSNSFLTKCRVKKSSSDLMVPLMKAGLDRDRGVGDTKGCEMMLPVLFLVLHFVMKHTSRAGASSLLLTAAAQGYLCQSGG